MRRVVCAAIRAGDGTLMLGIRHYSKDMHDQLEQRMDGFKFRNRLDEDQGFVDQWGAWMSREEAYEVARQSGGIRNHSSVGEGLNGLKLYSEALY
jgi:hypothetical protein